MDLFYITITKQQQQSNNNNTFGVKRDLRVWRNVEWVGAWEELCQILYSSRRYNILLWNFVTSHESFFLFTPSYCPWSFKHQLKNQYLLVRWDAFVEPLHDLWVNFSVHFSIVALNYHTILFSHVFIHLLCLLFIENLYAP